MAAIAILNKEVPSIFYKMGLKSALLSLIIFFAFPVSIFAIYIPELLSPEPFGGYSNAGLLPLIFLYFFFLWWLLPIFAILIPVIVFFKNKKKYTKKIKYLVSNVFVSVSSLAVIAFLLFVYVISNIKFN